MAQSVLKLVVDDKEYEASLKRAKAGMQDLQQSLQTAGKTFDQVDQSVVDYAKAIGNMATVSQTAKGKLNEMTSTFTELSVQYKQLTDEEKNSPFGKALAESLDTLKGRIIDSKRELDDVKSSLTETANEGSKTGGIMQQLAGKFTVNVDAMKVFNLGLQAAGKALQVAKDAFFNNEQMLDEWGRTVASCESVYKGFLNAINTGDITGFLSNIRQITQAARDAYDALDELATFNAFNKANIAEKRADLTGAIADYREGKGGAEGVQNASEALINELIEKQRLQKEAYDKAVASLARERQVNPDDLMKVMTGDWGSFKELKEMAMSKKQVSFTSTGGTFTTGPTFKAITEYLPANERERLAQAVQNINDTEIDALQSLAEAAKMTQVEINNQRKQVARILSGQRDGGNGGESGGAGGAGTVTTPAVIGSIDEQTKKVQELQKAWRAAADDDSRAKYAQQIQDAQSVLNRMTSTIPVGSIKDLNSQLSELRKKQEEATSTREWESYNEQIQNVTQRIRELKGEIGISVATLRQIGDVTVQDWASKRQQQLQTGTIDFTDLNRQLPERLPSRDAYADTTKVVSGLQSVSSGLQQMGVTLPDGVNKLLGGIQGLLTVIQGVQSVVSVFNTTTAVTQTAATYMNTSAIAGLTGAIVANTAAITANTLTPSVFAGGGIVRAASGWVGGTRFSGDRVPALLNSGELVLNQAQQGNLASQLQASRAGYVDEGGKGYVSGQNVYIGTNNYLKGSGQGQLVTTRMLRQYGLIS